MNVQVMPRHLYYVLQVCYSRVNATPAFFYFITTSDYSIITRTPTATLWLCPQYVQKKIICDKSRDLNWIEST